VFQLHYHISQPSQVCDTRSPSQNSPSPSRLEFGTLHHSREGVVFYSNLTWLYRQKVVSGIKKINFLMLLMFHSKLCFLLQ
jgi:hypothetical protein